MKETVLEKTQGAWPKVGQIRRSCASSGVTRRHRAGGVGSTAGGAYVTLFTADGRCVSLLKIMLTNVASTTAPTASTGAATTFGGRLSRRANWPN